MLEQDKRIRNVAHEAVLSSADLLPGLVEAIPIPVLILTPDTRIRNANAAFVQTLQLGQDHYLHQRLPGRWLMHPQEDLPRLRELLYRTSQTGAAPETMRLSWRCSEGIEVATEIQAHPLCNLSSDSGHLIVVTLQPTDSQEHASAEKGNHPSCAEKQDRSEEHFRVLFECAPDGYFLYDLQGRFVDGNRAAEEIIGYQRHELIGKSFLKLNLLSKSQITRAARALIESAVGKPTGPEEFTLRRKDNSTIPIEVRTYPVRLDGQVLVLGIARDITERKRTQEALISEKAFADSVINSMPGLFYMFDENGRYVWWNKNLETVSGYSADELPHVHPTDFFEDDDHERIKAAVAKTFRDGQVTIEAEFVSKDGTKTPYYFNGVRVEREGKRYLVGLGIDITERRQAQAARERLNGELQKSVRELERSNRELADFAHITAHDLKAPLRGVSTLADWLIEDYGAQLDAEGLEHLHLVRRRVDRMGQLIDGILHYSEIGYGDHEVEILDTHALVEEVIEQLGPPDHIQVTIENTLPSLPAERTRLTQVFQNLISNAIKYIDKPQGEIQISAYDTDAFWEFRVTDNGPGIEAKHFAHIFQMFQTLSVVDHGNSTGLGLAVAKKIVELYGGRVWLESQMGQGTTFFFTLPKHLHHTPQVTHLS